MKLLPFLIFFSIVLLILTAVNFYITKRVLQVIPVDSALRTPFLILIIFLSLAFILGRFFERIDINPFSSFLIWAGSIYFAIMLYAFLQLALLDFFRLLNHWFSIFPKFVTANWQSAKNVTAIAVLIVTIVTVGLGFLNTRNPITKNLELKINKNAGRYKSLKIAMVSDIHLGTIYGGKFLSGIVKRINSFNPDLILMPGDIIDEDISPVLENGAGEELLKLKSKFGVFAVTGNHEYIGGVLKAKKYLDKHNVTLLNDESVLIDSSFYIVGREDLSLGNFGDGKRKPLDEIMQSVNLEKPVILLDHQPFRLENAVNNGVDLQLSGHTHHGQLWPLNFITKAIYELSWGYLKKANTHFYVSCGVGGWGPPVRTGSRPEVLNITLNFN